MVKYITLCSGIECVSVAAHGLGWDPLCFSEIEKFPSAVLAHHYPNTPNVGDMTAHDWRQYRGHCDVLVAGTPCQAFSVAGRRESLADDRGNLTLAFAEICDEIEPSVIVWENVPGVLSAKDNAFGCLLGKLAGETAAIVPHGGRWTDAGVVAGPRRTIAWRILDAQYFGLAQRRKRVFLVACPHSSGIDPAEILFESDGVRRYSPPRRETGEEVAAGDGAGVNGGGEWGLNEVAAAVTSKWAKGTGGPAGDECQNLVVFHPLQDPIFSMDFSHAISCGSAGVQCNIGVISRVGVRLLMPIEGERLQGLPDNYTLVPWHKGMATDGPRYKAIGNGMAVNVVRWILRRVERRLT